MAAAMPATKRRVQELSIEPVGGRSTAVPAGRFDRGCVRGAAFELPELMERAMVARGHAFPAVPYPSAGIRSCGAKTRADASLRHTQQAGDGTNVDRCEFDTLVRIDGHAAQLRDGDMAGQRVQSGELPQHADDGFVRVEPAAMEHIAQTRTQNPFIQGEDGQRQDDLAGSFDITPLRTSTRG